MAGAGQDSPGPRERNRQERSARILGAARDLFSAQGYAATTTQQIADRAGLPIATLFRYARSKAELLILVTNDSFDASVRQGISAAAGHAEPEAACRALLAPVVRAGLSAPELTGHYQRELTFGATDDPGRAAGLRIVAELTGELARCLSPGPPEPAARPAAEALFASLHLLLVQAVPHALDEARIMTTLGEQATLLAAGLLVRNRVIGPTRPGAPATGNEAHHD